LEGDANGAPHADPSVYAKKYIGRYEHRNINRNRSFVTPSLARTSFAPSPRKVGLFK
jgi:hypothetical protein